MEQFKMEGDFRPRKLFREPKVHCCNHRVVTWWGLGGKGIEVEAPSVLGVRLGAGMSVERLLREQTFQGLF